MKLYIQSIIYYNLTIIYYTILYPDYQNILKNPSFRNPHHSAKNNPIQNSLPSSKHHPPQQPLPDSSGFASRGGAPLIRLYFRGIQSPRCDPSSQDPDTCETINVCSAVFRKFVPPADSDTHGTR